MSKKINIGLITYKDINLIETENNKDTILLKVTDNLLNIKNDITLNDVMITNGVCYHSDKHVYTVFYLLINKKIKIKLNTKANCLACHNDSIYGNAVLLKTDYNNKIETITKEEIEYILDIKKDNMCYLITSDNKVIQKHFKYFDIKDFEIFRKPVCIKFVLFGYMIKVFLDVEPKNQELNKVITAIYKNFKIKGDVLFYIGRLDKGNLMEYINLDIDDIYVLLNLIINKDINDPSQFEFKHSFMYSIYYNYNKLPDKIFGDYSKVMMIKNNISNDALFNMFVETVEIDKEIMEGPILNEHINYEKVMNKKKDDKEKAENKEDKKDIIKEENKELEKDVKETAKNKELEKNDKEKEENKELEKDNKNVSEKAENKELEKE